MKETVLITGGAGYLGSVLTGLLLHYGYKVRLIDLLNHGGRAIISYYNHPNFELIKGDIGNDEQIRQISQGVDYIIHMAAIVGQPACDQAPELAIQTNLDYTIKLYNYANNLGVKKLLYTSSCSVYGTTLKSGEFITEESEINPISLYGETKIKSEEFLLKQSSYNNCKNTILRLSTVFGISPQMRFNLTINKLVRKFVNNEEIIIVGKNLWRPYLHIMDICKAIILFLQADSHIIDNQIFNVGDIDFNFTKKMLIEKIAQCYPNLKSKIIFDDLQEPDDKRDYKISFSKIRNTLNFKASRSLESGIIEIGRYVEDNLS